MPRRAHPWSEQISPRNIPTPAHARSTWPSTRAPTSSPTEGASKVRRVVLWSMVISLVFVCVVVALGYNTEHFVPIAVVGSLGVFVTAAVVLNDRLEDSS